MRHLDPITDSELHDRAMQDREDRSVITTTVYVETDFRLLSIPGTKFVVDAEATVTRYGNSIPEVTDLDLKAVYTEHAYEHEENLIRIDMFAFEKMNKTAYEELIFKIQKYIIKKSKDMPISNLTYREVL